MAAYLSPVFGAGWQCFDNQGRVLAGGLLNTYLAGSVSTPQATWTTSSQAVPNANPIALNSAGRFAQEIWLQGGVAYKFVLTDANSNVIGTWDNVSGLNDPSFSTSEWIQTNVVATFVNATTFTVPGNQTNLFTVNRRIQAFTGAGTVYGYVVSSTYSNPNTTVVVAIDAGNLDSGLTTVNVGLLNSINPSVPQTYLHAGVTVGGVIFLAKSAPIASAGTVDLSTATGNEVHITGNTGPITSFGTVPAGVEMTLIFDSNPTVTYNAGSLIIPGAQSVTVTAGDVWKVISEGGGNWRVVSITQSSFYPISSPGSYGAVGNNSLNNAGTPNTKYDLVANAISFGPVTKYNPGTITNDVTVAGPTANGRDQAGAFSASSWIHFYWIWNGTTVATLSSATAPPTGPTLPSGYTNWAYCGAVFFNGSSQLVKVRIRGAWARYETFQSALSNGAATTETAVSLTAIIPPNALEFAAHGQVGMTTASGNGDTQAQLRVVSGSNYAVARCRIVGVTGAAAEEVGWGEIVFPNINQNMYYLNSVAVGGSPVLDILVTGYKLPNNGE